ncbi:MAG: GNAT family N-acetyltransferase [Elusimicrobiales bacterium]|nr:GNAT family N-acetyltransferase [Elusimicrobiales bacterium]
MVKFSFIEKPDRKTLAQLSALYREAGWQDEGDTSGLYRRIVRGSHCFAIAFEGGRVVGMARAISDRASDAYLQDVMVSREFRKRGIASRLVNMLCRRLRSDGINWVALISAGAARTLYSRAGFAPMKAHEPMKLRKR